jgi:hypothetical protein
MQRHFWADSGPVRGVISPSCIIPVRAMASASGRWVMRQPISSQLFQGVA